MYKILIVDDEDMIRNGIRDAFPWAEFDIGEVETAGSGEEAEQIFKIFLPDIVLADIKMHGMDGLELLQIIKNFKTDVKFIILSGFDDFSYAQTALKLGAFEYLLKTSDIDELKRVIQKALDKISEDKKNEELDLKLQQQLTMSLPLLRYRYLNELIYGCIDPDTLVEKMEFVDLRLKSDFFIVTVAEIDDFAQLTVDMTEEERLLLKLRLLNIIESLLNQGICFESKYEEFVLIYFCEDSLSADENKEKFIFKCEDISNFVSINTDMTVSMGVSNTCEGMFSIAACYEEAKKALGYRLFSGKGSIIDARYVAHYTNVSFQIDPNMERKLTSSLRVGDKKQVLEIIQGIFSLIHSRKELSIGNFQRICIDVIGIASRVLCEYEIDMQELFGRDYLYFMEINKYETFEDTRKWVVSIFERIADYIVKTKIIKARKIVQTAKQYINEHYNEELTLNKIADIVYMSPNYFSSLFSSEVGQSFLEYVTTLRIEKAKQLLGDNDSKAFEVGERVGYDNPQYFSRIFKKHTGMSPQEYKRNLKSISQELEE